MDTQATKAGIADFRPTCLEGHLHTLLFYLGQENHLCDLGWRELIAKLAKIWGEFSCHSISRTKGNLGCAGG